MAVKGYRPPKVVCLLPVKAGHRPGDGICAVKIDERLAAYARRCTILDGGPRRDLPRLYEKESLVWGQGWPTCACATSKGQDAVIVSSRSLDKNRNTGSSPVEITS